MLRDTGGEKGEKYGEWGDWLNLIRKCIRSFFVFRPLENPLETASSADREENKEKAEKMSAKQRDLLALSRQGSCVKWMLSN